MMRKILTLIFTAIALTTWATPFVVVIDAGHGGHDGGAPGSITNEKNVNLEVATRLGDALKKELKNDVKVILTRDADFFVKLGERAEIANRANADIFVSIHCNSIANKQRRNQVQGASLYVRGFASSKQASEVAARENASLEMESGKSGGSSSAEESVLSDLKWNKNLDESITLASTLLDMLVGSAGRKRGEVEQNDLAVLKRTNMPAVLVELDYICNPQMERYLASAAGQTNMAEALCQGIVAYKNTPASRRKGGKSVASTATVTKPSVKPSVKPETKPEAKPSAKPDKSKGNAETTVCCGPNRDASKEGTRYKIQFLLASKVFPAGARQFKGLTDTDYYIDGKMVKYTVGSYNTQAEAEAQLPKIRQLFPDAFIITTVNGKRVK